MKGLRAQIWMLGATPTAPVISIAAVSLSGVLLVGALLSSAPAGAQTTPLVVSPESAVATPPAPVGTTTVAPAPPGHSAHLVIGGGLSLGAVTPLYVTEPATHDDDSVEPVLEELVPASRWRGGVLLDESSRDALRLSDHADRERAASVSDAILGATVAYSFLIDALGAPLAQGHPQLALESGVAYSLSLGMTLVLGEIIKHGVARARPFERYCIDDPDAPGCSDDDRFASFYSLHSAVAFVSAGFSCAMHLSRSLYQDVATDALSCAASLALATTVAGLRVAADRHYLTDVLIGSVMGFAVGYIVPLFLVSQRPPPGTEMPGADGSAALVMPLTGAGSAIAISVGGDF